MVIHFLNKKKLVSPSTCRLTFTVATGHPAVESVEDSQHPEHHPDERQAWLVVGDPERSCRNEGCRLDHLGVALPAVVAPREGVLPSVDPVPQRSDHDHDPGEVLDVRNQGQESHETSDAEHEAPQHDPDSGLAPHLPQLLDHLALLQVRTLLRYKK